VVILVSYDLHKPVKDYEKLHVAIKNLGNWWHYLESVWLIETNSSASDIGKHLIQFIDKDDRLTAIRVSKDYDGWLPTEAWNWLNAKVM